MFHDLKMSNRTLLVKGAKGSTCYEYGKRTSESGIFPKQTVLKDNNIFEDLEAFHHRSDNISHCGRILKAI